MSGGRRSEGEHKHSICTTLAVLFEITKELEKNLSSEIILYENGNSIFFSMQTLIPSIMSQCLMAKLARLYIHNQA